MIKSSSITIPAYFKDVLTVSDYNVIMANLRLAYEAGYERGYDEGYDDGHSDCFETYATTRTVDAQ